MAMSPFLRCLSTIKPVSKASATFSLSITNSSLIRLPSCLIMYSAPGYTSGPFITSLRISSMFHSVIFSGTDNRMAISSGTPTSFMSRFGSGEITVRAEKSTLLPERLLLNLPSFPFNLCESVFNALPERCLAGGIPEASLL